MMSRISAIATTEKFPNPSLEMSGQYASRYSLEEFAHCKGLKHHGGSSRVSAAGTRSLQPRKSDSEDKMASGLSLVPRGSKHSVVQFV